MGGFLESLATTVSEFTPGPVVDLLTHQRLFSAQLQVSIASTCSYDKIQYFKINLFFFLLQLDFKGIHTHPVNSYPAAFWLHREHPPGMPTCTREKVKNTFASLQFHTCYCYFMYNYIWLAQIKGWLRLSIMGIKKMPSTCCNVITSCVLETLLSEECGYMEEYKTFLLKHLSDQLYHCSQWRSCCQMH